MVLAHFRKDARLSLELDEIVKDDEDKVLHPTIARDRSLRSGWKCAPLRQT